MLNMNSLITIGIPVYNVEKYVEECIMSVLNQTYNNMDIIIIDDRGTDNSMKIVESIIKKYHGNKTIRIISHDKNKGLSEARNTAIKNANGEYLYFIDSDDYMTNDCIEVLYHTIMNNDVDFVAASYQEVNEDGSDRHIAKKLKDVTIKRDNVIKEFFFKNYSQNNIATTWNKLFKLDFLRKNNLSFIPGIFYEDNIFTFQICTLCKSFTFISNTTYFYRQRNNSIMHTGKESFTEKEIKDRCFVLKKEKECLKYYINYIFFDRILLQYCEESYFYAKGYMNHNKEGIMLQMYIKNFLYYPLDIVDLFKIKKNFYKHLFFWMINKLPYCIIKKIL